MRLFGPIVALVVCMACSGAGGADQSANGSADTRRAVDTPVVVDTARDRTAQANDPPPALDPRAPDSLIGLVTAPDSLLELFETREYGYEERALTVYAIRERWYLVRTRDSTRTWLRAAGVDSFMPLDSLLYDRLHYLTEAWDGELRSAPASTASRVLVSTPLRANHSDIGYTPTRVLRTRRVDASTWWAEVEVMSASICDDEEPRALASGWVPLWGTNSAPTVWYFSRGC